MIAISKRAVLLVDERLQFFNHHPPIKISLTASIGLRITTRSELVDAIRRNTVDADDYQRHDRALGDKLLRFLIHVPLAGRKEGCRRIKTILPVLPVENGIPLSPFLVVTRR